MNSKSEDGGQRLSGSSRPIHDGDGKRRVPQIEDVAREAGVSIATVSYVLNERGRVSAATRERVRKVIQDLGYVSSARGRSLALGQSQTVGLFASQDMVNSEGFAPLVSSLTLALLDKGYQLLLLGGEVTGGVSSLREVADSGRVDGVVVMALDGEALGWESSIHIPLVLLGPGASGFARVDVDHGAAAQLAAKHLLDLGHRQLGLVAYPSALAELWERACQGVVTDASGTLVTISGSRGFRGGYEAAKSLLTGIGRPTGLIVLDDAMAEGAIAAAGDLGIGVPERLSVIGYGNTHHGAQAFPPITTISPHWEALGSVAGLTILDTLEGQSPAGGVVEPTLVVRESTAPAGSFATPEVDMDEPVIKSGPAFALWSKQLSMSPASGRHGLYMGDTRMISLYQVRADGRPLTPAAVEHDGGQIRASYITKTAASTFRMMRRITIAPDELVDEWSWNWWGPVFPVVIELSVASDFQDIFAVRGMTPGGHGTVVSRSDTSAIDIIYEGRDEIRRSVRIGVDRVPAQLTDFGWSWSLPVEPSSGALTITTNWSNPVISLIPSREIPWPLVEIRDADWTGALRRAHEDLAMLATVYEGGLAPMAGLPWFGTLFGRDAIITGLETLAFAPELSIGVARVLARLQGTQVSLETEEEPGKIIHELRLGEMARVKEIPFGRYYGSVDATPLFVTLVARTWRRTGDRSFLNEMLPAVELAVEWIRTQRNEEGLFEFHPRNAEGLLVQSWKDSSDSMVFADGSHGAPPLAVAEVQGYVYQAFKALAMTYRSIGRVEEAEDLELEAESVQVAFHEAFWLKDRDYYALAVDGIGRQLDSLSSDPGQCLWSGIVPKRYREPTQRRLLSPALFSGWGIRTLGSSESAYDPYSYHRGSVWPHDTALIAAGLRASGDLLGAGRVARALLDAAALFPQHRLPELFSGEERGNRGPFPYPGACSPQAWAAGAVWQVTATLLGLEVDAIERIVSLSPLEIARTHPIRIRGLPVAGSLVDIEWDAGQVSCSELPEGWCIETAPL